MHKWQRHAQSMTVLGLFVDGFSLFGICENKNLIEIESLLSRYEINGRCDVLSTGH